MLAFQPHFIRCFCAMKLAHPAALPLPHHSSQHQLVTVQSREVGEFLSYKDLDQSCSLFLVMNTVLFVKQAEPRGDLASSMQGLVSYIEIVCMEKGGKELCKLFLAV